MPETNCKSGLCTFSTRQAHLDQSHRPHARSHGISTGLAARRRRDGGVWSQAFPGPFLSCRVGAFLLSTFQEAELLGTVLFRRFLISKNKVRLQLSHSVIRVDLLKCTETNKCQSVKSGWQSPCAISPNRHDFCASRHKQKSALYPHNNVSCVTSDNGFAQREYNNYRYLDAGGLIIYILHQSFGILHTRSGNQQLALTDTARLMTLLSNLYHMKFGQTRLFRDGANKQCHILSILV